MIFVRYNEIISQRMRGNDIAGWLGVPCLLQSVGDEKNGMVVFVKWAFPELVMAAKEAGNVTVLDILDWFCYKNRGSPPYPELIDWVIIPNMECWDFYSQIFLNARPYLIPHQWDDRVTGLARQDSFRPGYVGNEFNVPDFWQGQPAVVDPRDMARHAHYFNFHIAVNSNSAKHTLLKPSTKIAMAAAVMANVVSSRHPSAVELLGKDYPFYTDGDDEAVVKKAEDAFGGPLWGRGLEIMSEVRARTSLEAIASRYRALETVALTGDRAYGT